LADSSTVTAPAGTTATRVAVVSTSTDFSNAAGVVVGGAQDRALPTTPGAALDLGPLAEGTTLDFYIRPNGAATRLSGPDSVHVARGGPEAATVAFEDSLDRDFDDLVLDVRFTAPQGTGGSSPAAPPAGAVDWDALAAAVTATHAATGQWSAPAEDAWPTRLVDGTDWNALAAQVEANHAATGQWFA